jgi:hypothetical protein
MSSSVALKRPERSFGGMIASSVTELIQVFRKAFKQRATRAREKQLNVRWGFEMLTKHDFLLERKSPVEWPERRQYYAEQCWETVPEVLCRKSSYIDFAELLRIKIHPASGRGFFGWRSRLRTCEQDPIRSGRDR